LPLFVSKHSSPSTMEVPKKRKRDVDCPRITYDTSTKVFDRLFKGADESIFIYFVDVNRYMFRGIIGRDEKCCAQETWLVLFTSGASFSTARRKTDSLGRWYSSQSLI
jgi:hypothetical protein